MIAIADTCADCRGRCCREMIVPINGFDATRLARAYDLPLHAFVDAIDDESEHVGAFRTGSRRCALVLAKSPRDPGACTFLEPASDGTERCAVWNDRPRVCAIFPMQIANGTIEVRSNSTCAESNWNRATLTQEYWRAFVAEDARDWRAYAAIVQRWNAGVDAEIDDGGSTFLTFVGHACR